MVDRLRFTQIETLAFERGFSAVAAVPVARTSPEFREWFKACIRRGLTADLHYLDREDRFNPEAILPGAQSLFLLRYPYRFRSVERKLRAAPFKVARYAWQKDYHITLKAKLAEVMSGASIEGRAVTDSAPLAERYWARLAGLGKIGRSGMLIAQGQGTYFLIAAFLTQERLDAGVASPLTRAGIEDDLTSICGECRLCIEACPTTALFGDGLMDAEKCISYQTIERRDDRVDVFPGQKRHRWIFGCDICQQVCPHNKTSAYFAADEFADEHDAAHEIAAGRVPQLRRDLKNSSFYRRGLSKLAANIAAVRPE